RLEPVGVAEHPVDHVAPEGAAGHSKLGAIHPGIARERRVEPSHQIAVNLAAPVATHGVDELLTVSEGAARVDDDEAEALRGEHLVVPAAVPLVEPLALRPAVN